MSRVRISSPAPSRMAEAARYGGTRSGRMLGWMPRSRLTTAVVVAILIGGCSAGPGATQSSPSFAESAAPTATASAPVPSTSETSRRRLPSRSPGKPSTSMARRRARTTPGPSTMPERLPTSSVVATARRSSATPGRTGSRTTPGRSLRRQRPHRLGSGTRQPGSTVWVSSSSPARPIRRRSSTTCGRTIRRQGRGRSCPHLERRRSRATAPAPRSGRTVASGSATDSPRSKPVSRIRGPTISRPAAGPTRLPPAGDRSSDASTDAGGPMPVSWPSTPARRPASWPWMTGGPFATAHGPR